jgi:hypothetical protein
MKNELSDIHLLIWDETTTSSGIDQARIQKMYAPKHEMSKFHPNFKRLIESKKKMTGLFKETAKKNEPWYTSSKKTSLGYTLLYDLNLKQSSMINPMTAEEIWKSQPKFQKYQLNDFKKYSKNMKKWFLIGLCVWQQKRLSIRRICNTICKNKQLAEVLHFGSNTQIKRCFLRMLKMALTNLWQKGQLWESWAKYQAFPYDFFHKCANTVQQKALAAPYWQYKRNKNGREQQRLETDEMRKNGLWVLRWKRWLTCLNKLLFPPSVCRKYILCLASGGSGNGRDGDGVVWGGNSRQYWRSFGEDTWLGGWCHHGEEDGPLWCSCRHRMQDARRMAAKL